MTDRIDRGQASGEYDGLHELGEARRVAVHSEVVTQDCDEDRAEGDADEVNSAPAQHRAAQNDRDHGGEEIWRAERQVGSSELAGQEHGGGAGER